VRKDPVGKPKTVDEYLESVTPARRRALQQLRETIRSAAPGAEECISYGIPGFRLGGKLLVSFGAAANHCAFYPGAHPLEAHRREVDRYDTSRGTIRFPEDRPLPAPLVRALVETRVAEQAARKRSSADRATRRPRK